MTARPLPAATALLLGLTLIAAAALAKAPRISPEDFVRVTAEWQASGDLEEACANHGVDRQDFGLYMADLQQHDPAGYDELMALSMEGKESLAAGQPLSEDLLARAGARGEEAEEAVGQGRSAARWLLVLFAVLIPGIGIGAHVGFARMRQGTHQIYLEPLVDRFGADLGTDVDLLLADRGGLWAGYARLTAYAQLRGCFSGARFALTLEPESWGATNAGDMALVRGGPRRMLLAVSRGPDFPTQYAIASARRHRRQAGRARRSELPADAVASLDELGFSAEAIPRGVLLIKVGFDEADLEEGSVVTLMERAIGLIDR